MLYTLVTTDNQVQSFIGILTQLNLFILLFFAIISLIGTIDRFIPNLFPAYIKGLHNAKAANENSRFLRLIFSFLELFSIVIWKVSSAMFKFLIAIFTLFIVIAKKIGLPYVEKTAKSIEKTTRKIDDFSKRVEEMSEKVEDMSYKMNDGVDKSEVSHSKEVQS